MITERLMRLGSWKIVLEDETLAGDVDYFDHVVIIAGSLRNPGLLDDAGILSIAKYAGPVLGKDILGSRGKPIGLALSGFGLRFWLADAEGKGFVYETPREYTARTFAQVIDSASAPFGLMRDGAGAVTALTAGTVFSVAGTYTGTHTFEVQGDAIQYVADVFGAEYRINPDFSVDFGAESDLFVTTPTAVLVHRDAGGFDPNVEALPLKEFRSAIDAKGYATRAVLLGEGTGDTLITGSANRGSIPYLDPQGNAIARVIVVDEAGTAAGNANARASVALNASDLRKAITASLDEFDVDGIFAVGDTINIFDPSDPELVDTTNEVRYRGRVLYPRAIRVLGRSWAVTDDHTVLIRKQDGSYLDVTGAVAFEVDQGSQLELGAFPRSIKRPDTTSRSGRVHTNPDGNNNTIPAVPTVANTPWATSSYVDTEGRTRAQIVPEWNTPLNTDASTITDGARYDVRYRRAGAVAYQYTAVNWGTNIVLLQDLAPGVTYEIGVQAVDTAENLSGYSADESVVASPDTVPPSTPAPPTLAGNALNIQVTHELGKSTGGTFNLESDLDHLDVYASETSGFTPSAANKLGEIPATAANLTLGIPVIATFELATNHDTQRFVKVTAVDAAGNASTPSAQATVTASLIDTIHITDAAITTAKIANLAVTNAQIANATIQDAKIASLDAAKITTGLLDAARIDARSITTTKLEVGSFDNLMIDPSFEMLTSTEWVTEDGGGTWFVLTGGANARSGDQWIRYNTSGQTTNATFYFTRDRADPDANPHVVEGDQVLVEIYAKYTGTAPSGAFVRLLIDWRDETGTTVGSSFQTLTTPGTAYALLSWTATAPAGATNFHPAVRVVDSTDDATFYHFDDVYVRRMVGSALIEDAAITTAKIGAAQITSALIEDAAITTAKIGDLQVTAGKIANATITNAQIANATIEAAKINTVDADTITTGTLASARIVGTITGKTYRGTTGIVFSYDASTTSGLRLSSLTVQTLISNAVQLQVSASTLLTDNDFNPGADNTYGIGASGQRFVDVWAVDGTINTSDAGDKVDTGPTNLGLSFLRRLTPARFRWANRLDTGARDAMLASVAALQTEWEAIEDKPTPRSLEIEDEIIAAVAAGRRHTLGSRFHHGLVAQDVAAALAAEGIPSSGFAGYVDPGNGGSLGLRYHEFVAPIVAAINELADRLETLENP